MKRDLARPGYQAHTKFECIAAKEEWCHTPILRRLLQIRGYFSRTDVTIARRLPPEGVGEVVMRAT